MAQRHERQADSSRETGTGKPAAVGPRTGVTRHDPSRAHARPGPAVTPQSAAGAEAPREADDRGPENDPDLNVNAVAQHEDPAPAAHVRAARIGRGAAVKSTLEEEPESTSRRLLLYAATLVLAVLLVGLLAWLL
jgi:hypothetical protein